MAEILVSWKQYVEEECSIVVDTEEWEAENGEPWDQSKVDPGDLHDSGEVEIRESGGSEADRSSMTFRELDRR